MYHSIDRCDDIYRYITERVLVELAHEDVVVRSSHHHRDKDKDEDEDEDEECEAREEGDNVVEKMCECAETQGDCAEGAVACV